jgi:drug/metabolite transporter (DMT)-like permease
MNAIIPALAAVSQSASFLVDKAALRVRNMSFRGYLGMSFPLLFALSLGIFVVFAPPFTRELFAWPMSGIFALSALLIIVMNVVFYRAMAKDEMQELEVLELLERIPAIVVTAAVFSDERAPVVVGAALVSSLAIAWSHWTGKHFSIKRTSLHFLMLGLITAPIRVALTKVLLGMWHPISLEIARNAVFSTVFWPIYRRDMQTVPRRAALMVIVANLLTFAAAILGHMSYQLSGVVYTILLMSLQPFLVYLGAVIFLGERFHARKFAAFLVVLGSILAVQFG